MRRLFKITESLFGIETTLLARLTGAILIFIVILFIGMHAIKITRMWGGAISGKSGAIHRGDRPGEPIGADFTQYYAASFLTLTWAYPGPV